ncbi:FKBP-type peptidyl-prolyl cis-trans isomerase [Bdellovibrio sp. GT3]|uniref:FKBP-type peptidyl-prolyl cis-trans isomerase n=1 Tax=unclassified Bdellovibrio TaxID=2633795 RepID=UPI0030F2502C
MNKLVLGGLVVAMALTTACNRKVKLDTDIKKASYAIGQQIGGNLKQQNIDFDSDALAQALKDASVGKNEMTKEDMQAAMMKLQELAMKKQQEAADTNAKSGKDFLEKNKSAANVKTTASGLQYIMEKEGTGAMPKKEDVVKVHYKGTLTNGEQFDSSYDRGQPAEFPVGGVIPGWTEALQLMKVGSKAKLFIPPELAYGPSGRPGIPPNSVLVFEVELMDIVKADKPAAKAKK